MAALTNADYKDLRQSIYRFGSGKDELKALPKLPNKTQLKAAFQVFEDFWENNKTQVKANVDIAAGQTLSVTLVKKIGLAWLASKMRRGG